ncbi:MAG: hypothetical protein HKN21_17435 [Candidatus Eisenbacteria bacterium]|uniref:Oligosaccharyl transferase, archaeosortase A system-associated n=1 Tax=Eiseniibacteriota bacterium TaxID=2212470 RepID=A0A7Y2EHD5_UNCEI|nr:hypothetical protein [Candidatus Eisenbacteria bacterium]
MARVLLAATVLASFLLKVLPPLRFVLPGDYVRFLGADPWYHVRLAENLVRQFPKRVTFDPYAISPGGMEVPVAPLMDYLIAIPALILGLGNPSTELVELTAAYFPPVVGSLIPIPVYFFTKKIFGTAAGLFAAFLVVVMPSTLVFRSLLGFADHHVLEVALSTTTMAFLCYTLESEEPLSLKRGKTRIFLGLASLAFLSYLLGWIGSGYFVFLLSVFFILQSLVDHSLGRGINHTLIGACFFGLAGLLALPFIGSSGMLRLSVLATLAGAVMLLGLAAVSKLVEKRPSWLFPVLVLLLGVGSLLALKNFAPGIYNDFVGRIQLKPLTGGLGTVDEAKPLTYRQAWQMFRIGLPLGGLSLIFLCLGFFKDSRPGILLLLTWSVIMSQATFLQARFSYYLAVNVAILGGIALSWLVTWVRSKKAGAEKPAAMALVALCLLPTLNPLVRSSAGAGGPDKEWVHAMDWLRTSTPEPFSSADYYFSSYDDPQTIKTADYGIASLWDYGYWMIRLGHRVPASNPTQAGAQEVAKLFLANNPDSIAVHMKQRNAKYVMLDSKIAVYQQGRIVEGKFHSLPLWVGEWPHEYCEIFWARAGNDFVPKLYFHPTYFQTLAIRLALYNGDAFQPENGSSVLTYTVQNDFEGRRTKQIKAQRKFKYYPEALQYLNQVKAQGEEAVLVSDHPLISPIPLDPLPEFKQVYETPREDKPKTFIKIFEYQESR